MTQEKEKSQSQAPEGPVPKAVVNRLSLYLRELQHVIAAGSETTSSTQLGRRLGFTDAQVRKDLAYFGQFGYPGIGYRCDELIEQIRRILGTHQPWSVALVGTGNLGRALLRYKGFGDQGFHVVAAFDDDPHKVGTSLEGVEIYDIRDCQRVIAAKNIRLAILAVPATAAPEVAQTLAEAGIQGVLNFAPVTISVPDTVSLVGVDLAMELEQLTFAVASQPPSRSPSPPDTPEPPAPPEPH